MHNIAVSALVLKLQIDPRRRRVLVIAPCGFADLGAQQQQHQRHASTAQKMPMAIWVVRQPADCTPQLTSGGQIVPPT